MTDEMTRREMIRELDLLAILKKAGFAEVSLLCKLGGPATHPFEGWAAVAEVPRGPKEWGPKKAAATFAAAGATRLRALHNLVMKVQEAAEAKPVTNHLVLVPPQAPDDAG